jgi:serine/threonine protein kinase
MDSAPGWPGYDLTCLTCGAGCRSIDRFCSQCGRPDPSGHDDPMLSEPTFVVSGEEVVPSIAATDGLDRGTLVKEGRRKKTYDTSALQQLLMPGMVFGRRYRIQRFLGSGAMGYVCSAIDQSIDELVALKILSSPIQEDPEAFERFKLELKLARKIRHRNVVQSFDLGFADGIPFISMEYIDADNLLKHLDRRQSFEEPFALTVVRQVLRGLRAAHDLGIIHRDIKPENILLNKDNIAFITDFGIATSATLVRRRKELAGTPDYMAPEQLRMETVGPTSDLYSCGVMLYRMVAGVLPYRATTLTEVVDAHLHATPDPIPESAPVSSETRELIDWMLRKNPGERPQDARPLLERIDELLKSGVISRSGSRRMTVLVIEHEPETLAFIRSVLESDGYRVLATSNAREGVNFAFEQNPAMIFLDAKIRGGFDLPLAAEEHQEVAEGLEFVRIVRGDDKLQRVPIVLMTDKTLSQFERTFEEEGIADVIIKPLEKGDILEAARLITPAREQA